VRCSDLAWTELWTDFNRLTTDTIRIRREPLAEVIACNGGIMPDGLIARLPRDDSKTVEVVRHALFTFLNHHGALRCDQL
jgi:hypothetical protein